MPLNEAKDAVEWYTTLLRDKPESKTLKRRLEHWKSLLEVRKARLAAA